MITLASDFGSPYPAAMKGVILRRSDARLVDVVEEIGGIERIQRVSDTDTNGDDTDDPE